MRTLKKLWSDTKPFKHRIRWYDEDGTNIRLSLDNREGRWNHFPSSPELAQAVWDYFKENHLTVTCGYDFAGVERGSLKFYRIGYLARPLGYIGVGREITKLVKASSNDDAKRIVAKRLNRTYELYHPISSIELTEDEYLTAKVRFPEEAE